MNNCRLILLSLLQYYNIKDTSEFASFIKNLLQNNKISVSIVKNYIRYQFIMKQIVYQISCIYQNTWVEDNEVLKFHRISD